MAKKNPALIPVKAELSGPPARGHNVGFRLSVRRQAGITRGSEDCDQRADGWGQQNAATDANTVRDHIPQLNNAARREVLTRFEEDSQDEHRDACHNPASPIPESDHWQRGQCQVCAEVLDLVADVQAADGHHEGEAAGNKDPMTTQQNAAAQRNRITFRRASEEPREPLRSGRTCVDFRLEVSVLIFFSRASTTY